MITNQELKIEYIELSKLKMYEKNARKHEHKSIDGIVASIKSLE